MKKTKLTPTTNDQIQHAGNGLLPLQAMPQFTIIAPPKLPSFPLGPPPVAEPQKKKKGRPKKPVEQKVNLAAPAAVKPLKIALVGTAPSSRLLAPFNDPSWTIWGCSPGNMGPVLPRIDAWVEIHGTNLLEPENSSFAPQYIAWMNGLTIPLYMQDKQVCPNAIPVPKDELVKEFGPYFFTSSFAWMMAMAIKAGASEVALFGIDMASRDEYIIQRPGAFHFFQEASRRGVKMAAPYESDIFQPPALYGYSEVTPYGRKMRARDTELMQRVNAMQQQLNQLNHDLPYLQGAREDNDYMRSIQGGAQDNPTSVGYAYLERLRKEAKERPDLNQVSATLPS